MSCRFYLGIDVAKAKLDCLLLDMSNAKRKSKSIANSPDGVAALLSWLNKQEVAIQDVQVIMEPTGVYHERALFALAQAGLAVSLVNPAQLRKFAQGIGVKTKTDAADSAVLARYGAANHPPAWQPPSASARELRALLARRDAVAEDLQRERNRTEKAATAIDTPERVKQSLNEAITFLQKELAELQRAIDQHIDNDPELRRIWTLLHSIPGVGERVAGHMTALLAARQFQTAEQLAAYLGLVPVEWQSGSSVHGRPRMSKAGPAHLRALLYMPAVVAKTYNPHIRALYERLLAKGKPKMSAIGAAMRKLAHLCFGVVHSGQPYDANWAIKA